MLAVASIAFGAGVTWGESRCMPEINRMRDVFGAEIRRLDDRLNEHAKLPIHPGAATSNELRQMQERLTRLEKWMDEQNSRRR